MPKCMYFATQHGDLYVISMTIFALLVVFVHQNRHSLRKNWNRVERHLLYNIASKAYALWYNLMVFKCIMYRKLCLDIYIFFVLTCLVYRRKCIYVFFEYNKQLVCRIYIVFMSKLYRKCTAHVERNMYFTSKLPRNHVAMLHQMSMFCDIRALSGCFFRPLCSENCLDMHLLHWCLKLCVVHHDRCFWMWHLWRRPVETVSKMYSNCTQYSRFYIETASKLKYNVDISVRFTLHL